MHLNVIAEAVADSNFTDRCDACNQICDLITAEEIDSLSLSVIRTISICTECLCKEIYDDFTSDDY